MNLDSLSEVKKFLEFTLPPRKENHEGFLEITGFAHYETVNSRLYAYFLDPQKNPKTANLFVDSLSELIDEKTGCKIRPTNFVVATEVKTSSGNRIDITIDDKKNQSAIIIENKLFHYLDNPLKDYWSHFSYPVENKLGVLLTLAPEKIGKEHEATFINITHIEWMNRIKLKLKDLVLELNVSVYLHDFVNTIDSLTNTIEMNEQTKFYFQNATQINQAVQIRAEAERYLNQQMDKLAELLGLETYGNSVNWKNIWDKNNRRQTFYTILLEDLISGNNVVSIIIEVEREDLKHLKKFSSELKKNEDLKKFTLMDHTSNHYVHFLSRKYKIDENEIADLANYLFKIIESDFKSKMKLMLDIVDGAKS